MEQARGRDAQTPSAVPKAGWKDIVLRTKTEIGGDHVSMIAAGVAFYALLALFPAIAAVISIWALAFDPQEIVRQIDQLSGVLPEQALGIIRDQGQRVAASAGASAGLATAGGLLFSLYSASKGMKSIMEGLNIIYDEDEKRGFIKLNLSALALTLAMTLGIIVALALVVVLPLVVDSLGLGEIVATLVRYLRWPLLAVAAMLGLAALYRFGPSRAAPQWRWVSWGAGIATLVWLAGSILFSIFVTNLGSYNETYGSLGAVIVLLLWFWLSAFVVLVGAEFNSEMEHQTGRDTTTGPSRSRGERGAVAADTIGERTF